MFTLNTTFNTALTTMPATRSIRWVTEEDEYDDIQNLSEELRNQARTELREDVGSRRQALQSMRDWLKKNPRVVNCRLDSNFLLRFLRAKKFSVPQAQEALERYLLLRHSRAAEFRHLDCTSSEISELYDTGFLFPTPGTDQHGRRIVIVIPGRLDPYRVTKEAISRAASILIETLLESEEVQIKGLVYFCDGQGVSLPFLTICTPKEAVRVVKNGERTVPLRHKEIIGFNVPPAMKFVLDFGMSLISDKLRRRVKIYSSVEEAHQHVDKNLLPKEYGGQMTSAEMINLWREEMRAMRPRLLSHDEMSVDLGQYSAGAREGALSALKQPLGTCSSNVYGITGSFRKLEVD